MLGIMLLNAGRLQEAEEYLRRAVCLAPDSVDSHDSLGLCLARQGKPAEAIVSSAGPWKSNPSSETRGYILLLLYTVPETRKRR